MNIGICSCVVGCNGGPCKHQAAIILKYNVSINDMRLIYS